MNTTPTTPIPPGEDARRRGRMLPAAIAGGVVALLLAFGAGVATGALIEGPGYGWRGGPAFDGTPGGPGHHDRGDGS